MFTMFLSLIVEISKALEYPPVITRFTSSLKRKVADTSWGGRAYAHAHSMANFKATFFNDLWAMIA